MLEDAAQAYNPIIQAMIATANLQKQGQQQDIEKERNKELATQAKANLAAETQRIQNEHEHQLATIDLAGKAHSLAAEAQLMQTLSMAKDLHAKGVDIGKLGLSGLFNGGITHGANPQDQLNTPPQTLPQNATPVLGSTPVQQPQPQQQPDLNSIFPGPEQEAARVRGLAGAQAGGAAEAELPFQQQLATSKFEHDKQLRKMQTDAEKEVAGMHIKSAESIAKLSRGSQMAIANMENATHLKQINLEYGGTSETNQALLVGALTGEIKLNPSNPIQRNVLGSINEMGGRPVDSKELDALKQGQKLIPLFDKLKIFADKLPTSTAGAFMQGHALGAAKWAGVSTDTQNELNNIMSQAIQVGKSVEGMTGGRVLATQLSLDLNSLASGSVTKDQAISKLNNLKDYYTNQQEQILLGGMPDFQKELIFKRMGIKPAWLVTAPQKNALGHKLDEQESMKRGQPVYSN